ncbi:hypothetical protein [Methylobacterium sp. J-030]|nr:hypothetical protein [Methylobacterium sp. J-030]
MPRLYVHPDQASAQACVAGLTVDPGMLTPPASHITAALAAFS